MGLQRNACAFMSIAAVFGGFLGAQPPFSLVHERGELPLLVRVEQGVYARISELVPGGQVSFNRMGRRSRFVPTAPFVLYVWLQRKLSGNSPSVRSTERLRRRSSVNRLKQKRELSLSNFDVQPDWIYYSDGCMTPQGWKHVYLRFRTIRPWLCIGRSRAQPERGLIDPVPSLLPKKGLYSNIPGTFFHHHVSS